MDEFRKLLLCNYLSGGNPYSEVFEGHTRARNRMPMNCTETEDAIKLEFSVPGFKKEEVKIHFKDDILHVEAKKSNVEKEKYLRCERAEELNESIRLNNRKIVADSINAKLEDGVLYIELPINKKEESEHIIKIS